MTGRGALSESRLESINPSPVGEPARPCLDQNRARQEAAGFSCGECRVIREAYSAAA